MASSFSVSWIAALCIALVSTVSAHIDDACPLWLAPSHTSTKKEPRYGLFAGRAYRENETLPNPELAIPLVDFVQAYNRNTPLRDQIIEFVESNLWTSEFAGTAWEGNYSAPVAIPGIGVLAQYHSGISNVDFLQASILLRDKPKLPWSGVPHPSRGAVTPYHNATLRATQPIPAGMELFADFGNVWDGNYTDDQYQDTIHRYDYEAADKVIAALVDFYADQDSLSLDFQEDILDFVLGKVLGVAAGKHAKTIKSLIPENPRKLKRVLEAGGSFMHRYPDMVQTQEWLSENGICLNAIKPGLSTISQAGQGAFATRDFTDGETITISPMLHIADKDLMSMYSVEEYVDPRNGQPFLNYNRAAGPIGQQLLLNYCFGHAESSLLLFPLASHVTLINHHSKTPNAYLTWSRLSDKAGLANQHTYHDMTVEQLAQTDKVVVVMKVVAMEDIAAGEEIFIDYGSDWEKAWNTYQRQWEETRANEDHPWQAEDVRHYYQRRPLETAKTIQENPYPRNVGTACFLRTRERPDGFPMQEGATLDIAEWYDPISWDRYQGNRLYVVDVLEREESAEYFYNYTVLARATPEKLQKVVNVPHAACTFVNRPYTSDIHLPHAFRHEIGILDSHFPQMWRDRR